MHARYFNFLVKMLIIPVLTMSLLISMIPSIGNTVHADTNTTITVGLDGYANYKFAYEVLEKINAERAKEKLNPLVMNETMMQNAHLRAAECQIRFAHQRLASEDLYTLIPAAEVMGENIAIGQDTPTDVVNDWMRSEGHRKNILYSSYNSIGIGVVCYTNPFTGEEDYTWVQLFSSGITATNAIEPENTHNTWDINIDSDVYNYSLYLNDSTTSEEISSLEMRKGNAKQLNIRISENDSKGGRFLSNKKLKWKSDNDKVASVASGEITAKGYGQTNIHAYTSDDRLLKSIAVSVRPISKFSQKINVATKVTKVHGNPSFNLNAKLVTGDSNLTYNTNNSAVATVSKTGYVTIKGPGKAIITVNAPATFVYNATSAKATIIVKPSKAIIKSIKPGKKKATIKIKKSTGVTGYQVVYSTKKSKGFKSAGVTTKLTLTKKKLKSKKTYYFKVRAYKTIDGKKVYGSYSKPKKVKVK